MMIRTTVGVMAIALASVGITDRIRAQAVTGALQGNVVSSDGTPLAEVAVTIRSSALQGARTRTSDVRGRFAFLAIPAGSYTVELRRIGYALLRITDVAVPLGTTASLGTVRLTSQAIQLGEIVVSGARPLIDLTSAAAVTVLDSSTFRALPTSREFRSLVALVPHANASTFKGFGDGVNVAGATGLENGYFIDGIHATNALQDYGSVDLPYNFVKEVQILTGGYEAEFGRSQGAVVNVITNSGSNEFHGEVVSFFTNNALRAGPRWGVGESHIDRFSQYDAGFSLGGPLQRDRLWFYAAWNPLVETSDRSFPGVGTHPDKRTRQLFAGKLTWRATTRTDVSLTLLGDPSTRNVVGPPGGNVNATVADARAVLGRLTEGGTAVTLQVRQYAGARIILAGSVSRLDRRLDTGPRAGSSRDPAELARFDDNITNVTSGNLGTVGSSDAVRTAADASVTMVAAAHRVKFGAAYEANVVGQEEIDSDVSRNLNTTGGQRDTVYSWLQIHGVGRAHNDVKTLYAQDSWEIVPRLRLNFGLRWDGQYTAGDTGVGRNFTKQYAPRVGIVFQPRASENEKLYASFGRFYEQLAGGPVSIWYGSLSVTSSTYAHNPLINPAGGTTSGFSQVGEDWDRSTVSQHYDEFSVGYERQVGAVYRVGARGVGRAMRWVMEDGAPDANSPLIVGNPGRGLLSFLPKATRRYTALELTFERAGRGSLNYVASYVLSRNYGNYEGFFASAIGQGWPNGTAQFNYPAVVARATGLLPNDRIHVAKLFGSYRVSPRLTVGAAAVVRSGIPLSELRWSPDPYDLAFEQPRGTAGRTPATWNLDLRFSYDVPSPGGRLQPRLLLDVFNVGNQRRSQLVDQVHYTSPDHASVNPNYLAVTQYQPPLSARLGMVIGF